MEPITHFLTGACISRAGLNRKTAYATLVAALAAEAADIDMLWSLDGPVQSLKHHRGITHTFLAAPLVAAAVVGLAWLWHRWRKPKSGSQQVHWGWLYLIALLAALSHLFLDWTNNYGLRPFFPFNPHWYAGSFVFIAEPVLWLLLAAAFAVPWLLGLVEGEIGAKKNKFRGQGWAIFAILGMGLLWTLRWTTHEQAIQLVRHSGLTQAEQKRVAAEPYPLNPFRWHVLVETPAFYQFAEVNTLTEAVGSDDRADILYKPASTPAVEVAKQTQLGHVYLDWGSWALVRDLGPVPISGTQPPELLPGRHWTTVRFTDLRFAYDFLGQGDRTDRESLTGWVYVIDGREEAGQGMGNREQR